jgi:hypothetical protein
VAGDFEPPKMTCHDRLVEKSAAAIRGEPEGEAQASSFDRIGRPVAAGQRQCTALLMYGIAGQWTVRTIYDHEIYRIANALLEQYGAQAPQIVAEGADARRENGDVVAEIVWMAVLSAMLEYTRTERTPSEWLN